MRKGVAHALGAWPVGHAVRLALAYLAAAELGHLLSFKDAGQPFATFWPPAGLLLAALALSPFRTWPALLLAGGAANIASHVLLHEKSVPVSLGYCLANSLEAGLGAWLLRRFAGFPLTLRRTDEVIRLAGFSAGLSPLLGATIGAAMATWAFGDGYWLSFKAWWFSSALGVMLVAPVVFAWAEAGPASSLLKQPWRIGEALVLFAGLAMAAESVHGDLLPVRYAAPAFVLPFLLWAVLRFGMRTVAAALLVVAIIGVWNTSQGRGPFFMRGSPSSELITRVQGALAVANLCILLLAATVAERKQADHERIATVARLEQALAELRTLKEMIPMCAWCRRIRDGVDGWQKVELYLRTHMQTDVTHGICPECFDAQFGSPQDAEQHAG